jgi:hypothetical protein
MVAMGFNRDEIVHAVLNKKYVESAATYFLMAAKRQRSDSPGKNSLLTLVIFLRYFQFREISYIS